jgi:glycerol-3-phosphate O-acyltransferase
MKLVDTQIPISSKNWVNFDFIETLKIISSNLTNKDISDLKFAINNIKETHDVLLAPFCILMGKKPNREKKADGQIKDIWVKSMAKIL